MGMFPRKFWQRFRLLLVLAWVLTFSQPGEADEVTARHLIYLHGRIVQTQQDARPKHPEFGYYELEEILETFRKKGFQVSSSIRPKEATVSQSADQVVLLVRQLLEMGVPARNITVLGASMGAGITLLASARLQNPDLRFAILAACLSQNVSSLQTEEGKPPLGHILAIRESSDTLVEPCPAWQTDQSPTPQLVARELVLNTGRSHGVLYQPLPEWVDPVVDWANAP